MKQADMVFTIVEDNGKEYELRSISGDSTRFQMAQIRNDWPSQPPEAFALIMQQYIAWAAAKRTGSTDLKWEEFQFTADVQVKDTEVVDPTPPGQTPG